MQPQVGLPSRTFADKLGLALRSLSLSSAQTAAAVGVDKSVVSRWLNGSVLPSAHNQARLSAFLATRIDGFSALDWDRDYDEFAARLGLETGATGRGGPPGLALPIWDLLVSTAAVRGAAYEGFFRSTRPHPMGPGRYMHDHGMIRRDATGLLTLKMGSNGTEVEGWALPLRHQLFIIAADVTSGALLFGIFNGVGTAKVDVFDGLSLTPSLDVGNTPTAMVMYCERIGDLGDDPAADDRRIAELIALDGLIPEGGVNDALCAHLARDVGPAQLALGGDWLLSMPLTRSLARGPRAQR